MHALLWLLALFTTVMCQPLFDIEKQLYGLQEPQQLQMYDDVNGLTAVKRGRLLNLIGLNSRFTDPFRQRMIKKKIRSVRMDNEHIFDY
ncbi:unnamed protein product [Cylicocyclus nassatus]|uniref:Uncharacterized protein n=1 Tax=Cylicocyclus nassatus TaxID=53992 RepID=A0AA36M884_CYLNA|nr:unnamed protein product [Cylicocyclus nassatus]